jgi:hypothetical protein
MTSRSCALLFLLPGCFVTGGGGGGGGDDDTTAADQAQWSQLTTQLEKHRGEFLGEDVGDLTAAGKQLFWLDTTNFAPSLHRYDDSAASQLAYTFSIGSGDAANFRGSSDLVVTADPTTDPVTYAAYDANAAQHVAGTTTLTAPSGVQWDAYAVDGATVYIVDTSTPGTTALLRWQPGQAPTTVTTLESAGVAVGEFQDFGVQGNTMVFIESGRIWKLDLATKHAVWLMNMTEADGGVDFRADGVMFESASGVMFFPYATGALVNVTDKINANPFRVNGTFASAAKYLMSFARYKSYVLYVGQLGLFAYDMASDKIIPVLLENDTADFRIDYVRPVALDDGTGFVTGLTSTDGAVGAAGPTYKIDLTATLP